MARTDPRINITARDRTRAAFGSVERRLGGLRRSLGGLNVGLAGLVGVAGFGALIKSTVTAGDNFQKLSIRLGVSVEALSQLRHVADLSGVSMQTMTLGMQRATRRIAEAAQGTGEAKNALKELGLNASELVRLKPDRQLEAIAEAMQGVENQADKVRLAMKLFDTEGVALLQTMQGGAAGLREMRAEADRLGLTMTRAEADSMAKFNDTLTRIKASISGAAQSLVLSWGPALTNAINFLTNTAAPAFTFLLERLGLIKMAISGLGEDAVLARLQLVRDKIADIQSDISAEAPSPPSYLQIEEIKALGEEYAKLQSRLEQIRGTLTGAPETNDLGDGEEIPAGVFGITPEVLKTQADQFHQHQVLLRKMYFQRLKDEAAGEAATQKSIVSLRATTLSSTLNFMRALGSKSKAFQIAAIAVEALVAARRIFLSTQVAAAAALTPPPIGLGPVAGIPLAAAIKTMGTISAGLTLATGALQIAGLNGGESKAAPTFAADPFTDAPLETSTAENTTAATRTSSTTVQINLGDSPIISAEAVRALIEKINEQIDDGVVIRSLAVA